MWYNPVNGRVDVEERLVYKTQLYGLEWNASLSVDLNQNPIKIWKKNKLQKLSNLCDGRFGWCFCLSLGLYPQQTSHPKFFDRETFLVLVQHVFRLCGVGDGDDWICRVSRLEDHVVGDVGLDGQLGCQGSVTRKVTLVGQSQVCSWCQRHFDIKAICV